MIANAKTAYYTAYDASRKFLHPNNETRLAVTVNYTVFERYKLRRQFAIRVCKWVII